MALIKCPECSKMISDQCGTCPHCGFPITGLQPLSDAAVPTNADGANTVPSGKPVIQKPLVIIIAAAVVLVLIVGLIALIALQSGENDNIAPSESVTTTLDRAPSDTTETTSAATDPTVQLMDLTPYYGVYWGNTYLQISPAADDCFSVCYDESGGDAPEAAGIVEIVPISHIVDGKVMFPFEDSWGNIGKMELIFDNGEIIGTITVEEYAKTADFCVSEGTVTYYFWYDDPDYISDPEDAIDPDDLESQIVTAPRILIGDTYFDDITYTMPFTMDKLRQDIVQKGLNKFYVNKQSVAFDIAYLMPIKGRIVPFSTYDEYQLYVHAYFTNNDITYEKHMIIKYIYNDIGGWVYSSVQTIKTNQIDGQVQNPFFVKGKKIGNFGYDDYPANLPISMGELADDILYGDLNYIKVNGSCQWFDIASINIIKGTYWSNEFGDNLTLRVRIDYSSDTHTGYAEMDLSYGYYIDGGWELSMNYFSEDGIRHFFPTEKIEFQPKVADYSDANFLETAQQYFTVITQTSITTETTSDGTILQTITYDAVRDKQYLKEYYQVVLTAEFLGEKWVERVSTEFVSADYSQLLGLWEYRVGDEYIRIRILAALLDTTSNAQGVPEAWIAYDYESSGWGGEAYVEEYVLNEMDILWGQLPYTNYPPKLYVHETPMVVIEETAGKNTAGYNNINLTIHVDKNNGVYLKRASSNQLDISEGAFIKIEE